MAWRCGVGMTTTMIITYILWTIGENTLIEVHFPMAAAATETNG